MPRAAWGTRQVGVLRFLNGRSGLTSAAEVAEHLGCSGSAAWQSLDRLKAKKLVVSPLRGYWRLTTYGEKVIS